MAEPIPVILDTDIGDDVDDFWALIMMLRSPELDVRLITTAHGNVAFRARIVAKALQIAGRTDIPIGVGWRAAGCEQHRPCEADWAEDYDLAEYPGTIHDDGVGAICRTIRQSDRPITLVAIGALPNVAEALRRDPAIIENSRFVGMHGSVYQGYGGSPEPCAESNVRHHTPHCQHVFASDWHKTITPVDTCGHVRLEGEDYQRIRHSDEPLLQALKTHVDLYTAHAPWVKGYDPEARSSTLFDTVAVYLAFSEELVRIETLPIVVTDDGYTRVDDAGKPVRCALLWTDAPRLMALPEARMDAVLKRARARSGAA